MRERQRDRACGRRGERWKRGKRKVVIHRNIEARCKKKKNRLCARFWFYLFTRLLPYVFSYLQLWYFLTNVYQVVFFHWQLKNFWREVYLELLIKEYEKITLLNPSNFVRLFWNKPEFHWFIETKVYFFLPLYMSWALLWILLCAPDQRNNPYLGYTILRAERRNNNRTMK